jgi:hypothetical protein
MVEEVPEKCPEMNNDGCVGIIGRKNGKHAHLDLRHGAQLPCTTDIVEFEGQTDGSSWWSENRNLGGEFCK